MDVKDLSWVMERLYEELDLNCFDIYRAVIRKTNDVVILVTYPTDAPGVEVVVESNNDDVKKEVEEILKDDPENIQKLISELKKKYGNIKVYNVSEYDEAYILKIE